MQVQLETPPDHKYTPGEAGELRLLLDWKKPDSSAYLLWAAIGSFLVHLLVLVSLIGLSALPNPAPYVPSTVDLKKAVHLIVPPDLTQREPNKAEVSKEIDLDSLVQRPVTREKSPAVLRNRPSVPPSRPAPAPALPEPPKLAAQTPPPAMGNSPTLAPPPPIQPSIQIQTDQKPKLAFETPGVTKGIGDQQGLATPKLRPPTSSVSEATQSAAHQGGSGAVIGDAGDDPQSTVPGLSPQPTQGRLGSSLELMSDPQGVDFKPYLIRILASVRRNWFAVMPESAKLGRRGKVLVQFVISKDGSVPKLVIALPSGAEPLDRAAVAGISASNPFPPLPAEFRGREIRLQFAFTYNGK